MPKVANRCWATQPNGTKAGVPSPPMAALLRALGTKATLVPSVSAHQALVHGLAVTLYATVQANGAVTLRATRLGLNAVGTPAACAAAAKAKLANRAANGAKAGVVAKVANAAKPKPKAKAKRG